MNLTPCKRSSLLYLLLMAHLANGDAIAAEETIAESLWLPYLMEETSALPTYGVSIAVDPQGGVHAAYAVYTGTGQADQPAVYAYCAKQPEIRANWSFVRIGEAVQDVRLALDPEGRPRLMLFGPAYDPETTFRVQYQYAECDVGWTNAANWSLTTVARPIEAIGTREDNNNRYFAISPGGEVAFVYTDTTDNHHPGTFYMSCRSDPREVANWTETTLTTSYAFFKPSLAFAPDGNPRLAFGIYVEDELHLGYGECNGDSTDPTQWSYLGFMPIHGSATFSLQTDAGGRPRLAFSSGSFAAEPFTDHQLYYLWCTNGCTADAANWSFNNVGLFMTSGAVDLALDGQDHPHISYLVGEGLGYARGDQLAESDAPIWIHRIIESNASLAHDYQVLPILECTGSVWINGQRSSVALDERGNPYFGYDAQHVWTGTHWDPPYGDCYFKDITMTRLSFLLPAPTLSVRRSEGMIEIIFETGTLESADQIDGEWTAMADVRSPLRVPADGPGRFYRVRR